MRTSSKRLQKSKTFSKLPEDVLNTKTVKKRLQNQNLWFTGECNGMLCKISSSHLFGSGTNRYTPLIIYKRVFHNTTIYKYELGHTRIGPEWQMVDGLNKETGEFTYVNVQTKPNLTEWVLNHDCLKIISISFGYVNQDSHEIMLCNSWKTLIYVNTGKVFISSLSKNTIPVFHINLCLPRVTLHNFMRILVHILENMFTHICGP